MSATSKNTTEIRASELIGVIQPLTDSELFELYQHDDVKTQAANFFKELFFEWFFSRSGKDPPN